MGDFGLDACFKDGEPNLRVGDAIVEGGSGGVEIGCRLLEEGPDVSGIPEGIAEQTDGLKKFAGRSSTEGGEGCVKVEAMVRMEELPWGDSACR